MIASVRLRHRPSNGLGRCVLRAGSRPCRFTVRGVNHEFIERLADHPSSPFGQLGLGKHREVGNYKILSYRQQRFLRKFKWDSSLGRVDLQDWSSVYKDPSLPLLVDLGCGSGRFLLSISREFHGGLNCLGLEIRRALVERANEWSRMLGVSDNTRYLFANAVVAIGDLLRGYPGPVRLVCIQFPDPPLRHEGIVQQQLVKDLGDVVCPSGYVFFQSDNEYLVKDMCGLVRQSAPCFAPSILHHRLLQTEVQGLSRFVDPSSSVSGQQAGQDTAAGSRVAADSPARKGTATSNEAIEMSAGKASTPLVCPSQMFHPQPELLRHLISCASQDCGSFLPCPSVQCTDLGDLGMCTRVHIDNGTRNMPTQAMFHSQSCSIHTQACISMGWDHLEWLHHNPLGMPTERELYVIRGGRDIYRLLLTRKPVSQG